jgi:hypothetical protein
MDNKFKTVALRNSRNIPTTTDSFYSHKFSLSDKKIMLMPYQPVYSFKINKNNSINFYETLSEQKLDEHIKDRPTLFLGGVWNIKTDNTINVSLFRRMCYYLLHSTLYIDEYEKRYSYGFDEVILYKSIRDLSINEIYLLYNEYGTRMPYNMILLKYFLNKLPNDLNYNDKSNLSKLYNEIFNIIINYIHTSNFAQNYPVIKNYFLNAKIIDYDIFKESISSYRKYSGISSWIYEYLFSIMDIKLQRHIFEIILVDIILKLPKRFNIRDEIINNNNKYWLFDTNITSLNQIIQYTPILICSSEYKKLYVRERFDYITKNLNKIDYQIYVINDDNPANLFLINIYEYKNEEYYNKKNVNLIINQLNGIYEAQPYQPNSLFLNNEDNENNKITIDEIKIEQIQLYNTFLDLLNIFSNKNTFNKEKDFNEKKLKFEDNLKKMQEYINNPLFKDIKNKYLEQNNIYKQLDNLQKIKYNTNTKSINIFNPIAHTKTRANYTTTTENRIEATYKIRQDKRKKILKLKQKINEIKRSLLHNVNAIQNNDL